MKPKRHVSRRAFVSRSASMLVAAPAILGAGIRQAAAADQVDPSDPTATALSYVHDGAESSRSDPSQDCVSCQLYTGEDGAEWGPCALFPGKVVNANGWCSAWVLKA